MIQITLHQVSRKNQRNWIVGGFALTFVKGSIQINGETMSVAGLVALVQ